MRNHEGHHDRRRSVLAHSGTGFLAALLVLAGIAGCATQEKYNPDDENQITDEFDVGADRPPAAKTLLALSKLLSQQGREEQSEFVLLRSIRDYPRYTPAHAELAELYMRAGRLEDSRRVLADGLRHSPNDAVLLNNLGMCWMLEGDHEKALESFDRAAAARPGEARSRANKALALGLLGRYHECLSTYKEVVPAAIAHYNLAVICESRDDSDRAALEYKVARELDPDLEP